MVYTDQNVIQFGKGDVRIWRGINGTISEPQAMIIFQNQEPSPISRIEEDADLSRVSPGTFDPDKDMAMLFLNPESIDSVISVLKAAKRATFGEDNLVSTFLGEEHRIDNREME